MVYIYHTSIVISSVQSSYVQFHMVPIRFFMDAHTSYTYTILALTSPQSEVHMYSSIWFFMDAHTWYTYTILALRSPQSKVHMYGSIWFPYSSLWMHIHGIFMDTQYIYHTSIEIPSVQSSHVWFYTVPVRFFTDAYTFVYSHTFYMVPYTSIFLMSILASTTMSVLRWNIHLQMMTS